ncbi:hypothetical protein KAJ27_06030, partial [bacterium]|nr:hypothetical protein [bacterium]
MNAIQNLSIDHPFLNNPVTAAAMPSNIPTPQPIGEGAFAVNSFVIEDSFFRARLPRPVHWSVAWSDLMMTMFI